MYVRVVRFEDVDAERLQRLLDRVNAAGGPPPGVSSTGLTVLFDASQGSAVVLQHFATEQDMREAAKIFGAMDSAETPGTRVSVDECEVKLEREA